MEIGATGSGGFVPVVVDVEVLDPLHERHLVRILPSGAHAHVRGLVEGISARLTLMEAVVVKQFPIPEIEIGPDTEVMYHTRHSWADFFKPVDACSEVGGVSHGALSGGVHTKVSVDCNGWTSNLHTVQSSSVTVPGDVGHPQVIYELWRQSAHAAMLCAGYAYQPNSQLGDRWGAMDPSAQCLPSVLRAALLFQAVNLDLQMVWPCRRHRAWWVMYVPSLGNIDFAEWLPMGEVLRIHCLIPHICGWDTRDERALQQDQRECQTTGVEDGTYPMHMMAANGIGPTALQEGKFQDVSAHLTQQVSNFRSQIQAQSQQFPGQIESKNQSIQAEFESQLSHIRGLLSRRSREDGE